MTKPDLQGKYMAYDNALHEDTGFQRDLRIQAAITILSVINQLAEEKAIPEITKNARAALELLKAGGK